MKPKSRMIVGIILVCLGIILVGETTELFCIEDLFTTLIPLAFIVMGFWLIIRRKPKPDTFQPPPPPSYQHTEADMAADEPTGAPGPPPAPDATSQEPKISHSPETSEAGKLKYKKTFGDMFIDLKGTTLQDLEISVGMGDLEIRLEGGILSDGLNRIIISSFIGDIRIYAAPDMPVFAHCSSSVGDIDMLGRHSSGFGSSIDARTANYDSSPKKLYIACNNFIGDIRIYGL